MSNTFTKALGLIALTGLSTLIEAQTINWAPAGPVFTAGRSRNLVVDKNDGTGKTLYTGSASSGVFTSTNGGLTWAPLNDQGTVRNISYMAQAADGTVYAATGEGFLRSGQMAKAQVGTGLYKVNLTAKNLDMVAPSSVVGTIINRIACSNTGNIIAVAGNKGILISTNSGASFNSPAGLPTNTLASGQDVKFDNSGNIYCSIGSEKTNTISTKIYKSTDGGLTFNDITPIFSVLSTSNYGRIELAIAPSNNNVIYASAAFKAPAVPGNVPSLNGFFVSYDAGATWGLIHQGSAALDPLSNGASIASGDYAHVLVVNPTNPEQVFYAGYRLYVYTRNGGSNASPIGAWTPLGSPLAVNTQFYLHQNIHDIKIVGTSVSNAKFYFVTDAGIFRSSDGLLSYQPFYSGLVTGQFNSVSIQSYPTISSGSLNVNGSKINSNDGYIGGTGGNGLVFFDGNFPSVTQESNFTSGEIYNAEFSKILPNAAFYTGGAGGVFYRISDIKTSEPDAPDVNYYNGALSKITPVTSSFGNEATNASGTPFKLWENYGQIQKSPDSLVFYNDSITVQTSVQGALATLTTQTTFTFSTGRPSKFALIDSIAIRTGTVIAETPGAPLPPSFTGTDKKDIFIKLTPNYPVNPTVTSPSISLKTGPVAAAGVTLDAVSRLDEISVTFTSPPFANKTQQPTSTLPNPAVYYKVFATIFYKYAVGDSITITDNSISTKSLKYNFKLTTPLRWSKTGTNGPKPFSSATNPPQKIAARMSARLAMVYQSDFVTGTAKKPAILVSKSPLNLNDPLTFVRVSQNGALTTDATGAPVNTPINIKGKPILLEWSKSGTELYFATDSNAVYRVSNLYAIFDNSPSSYSGKLSTDIFMYTSKAAGTNTNNPNSPYRTTLLGTFTKPITSLSVGKEDTSMVLTFNDPTGTLVMRNSKSIKTSNFTNIGFISKTGNLTNLATYCSLIEKDTSRQVFIGTDNGIFYTSNIAAATPVWSNVNNNQLPNVQIFDLKQQTLESWNCYNSGQIYAATNGRGVWTNKLYNAPYVVSVEEVGGNITTENNLSIYPNPTNSNVNISFNSLNGEKAEITVMDLNGRVVKTENLGKLNNEPVNYSFDTSTLSSGMYIINVNSDSGVKRVAKLVVTK